MTLRALAGIASIGMTLALPLGAASGQEAAPLQPDTYWMHAGLGAGTEDFAGQAGLSYQHGAHLFSLRVAATSGLFDDGFADIALLYGRATRVGTRRFRAAGALGISAVDGCVSPGDGGLGGCGDRKTVIGLPVETQLAWLPAAFLGVGLYGFANLNSTRSFAGVTLGVQLGKVR